MITKMERVEIICLRDALHDVVTYLQGEGVVHLSEVPLAVDESPDLLDRVQLSEDQETRATALAELHRSLSDSLPLLSVKPSTVEVAAAAPKLETLKRAEQWRLARVWIRELRSFTRRRINAQDDIEVLNSFRQSLEQLRPLMGSANDVCLGRNARAFILKGDVATAIEKLDARLLEEIGPEANFIHKRIARDTLVGLVTYPEGRNEAVGSALKKEHIAPLDLPDKNLRGVALGEAIAKIDAKIAQHEAALADLSNQLDAFSHETGAKMTALEAIVRDDHAKYTVVDQFAQSEMTVAMQGWAPADRVDELQGNLNEKFSGQVLISLLAMEEVEVKQVPTLLKNHKLFQPFELLLGLFDPPTYGTHDPTPLVAVSFTLFYGFILGDWGYGLVIVGAAYWIRKKWGHSDLGRSVSSVAMAMGISSIVFGLIYGECFGDFFEKTAGDFSIFHRVHHTDTLLLYGVLFGVVHIPLALILGVRENLKHKHYDHAWEQLGSLLGLLAAIIGVCGFFNVPILSASFFQYLAIAMFLVGVVFIFKGMGSMGVIGVLEIVTLCGNILSYARLMALGVASVALADVANTVARDMGPLIGIPIALMVHALNIGIGVFSPAIHSLRLNLVEFLPKFYQPEGRRFEPFKKEATW